MGVGGLEIDISFQVLTRDGDREGQEGGRGIRDGPGEIKVGVKGVSKVDELFELLVGAQGGTDTVIDVTEEEVGDGASVASEEGLFHVTYKEAGISWAYAVPFGPVNKNPKGFYKYIKDKRVTREGIRPIKDQQDAYMKYDGVEYCPEVKCPPCMVDNGEPVDVVYLVFQKAFDKVPHLRLLHKIKLHGIT
eukprot:g21198.t1